jgi:hypothetical protein
MDITNEVIEEKLLDMPEPKDPDMVIGIIGEQVNKLKSYYAIDNEKLLELVFPYRYDRQKSGENSSGTQSWMGNVGIPAQFIKWFNKPYTLKMKQWLRPLAKTGWARVRE